MFESNLSDNWLLNWFFNFDCFRIHVAIMHNEEMRCIIQQSSINYPLIRTWVEIFDIKPSATWLTSLLHFLSFQGRCNREKPPCKYFHPPQHLKDQLLINGRNHLALKNALMQQMGMAPNGQPIITSQLQPMVSSRSIIHSSLYRARAKARTNMSFAFPPVFFAPNRD